MSSLIFKTQVLDYGDIQETEDAWVGRYKTKKVSFPNLVLIDETPPYEGNWAYENGVFHDLDKLREEEEKQSAEAFARQQQRGTDVHAKFVRKNRNDLLMASDWTQGKDISDEVSSVWAVYRQALRDLTEQEGFPWDVSWPEKPQ